MGWLQKSKQELRRVEVLTEVLAITDLQVNRLLIRFREDGGGGLIHKGEVSLRTTE